MLGALLLVGQAQCKATLGCGVGICGPAYGSSFLPGKAPTPEQDSSQRRRFPNLTYYSITATCALEVGKEKVALYGFPITGAGGATTFDPAHAARQAGPSRGRLRPRAYCVPKPAP
jgi:hypothetical protein